ncbi:MAG: helix-turn-helix domain-containing protein [Spirochaetia bacterium]|nr:helix-turn-helix domain-containing protein [Spirochaetia bacterium]
MGSDVYFYNSVIFFLIAAGNLVYYFSSRIISNFFWFIISSAMSYRQAYYGLYYGGILEDCSFLYGSESLVSYVSMALVYPLLKAVFEPEFIWRRRYWFFFLPPFLRLVFLYSYFIMPETERIEIVRFSVSNAIPRDLYNDPNIYLSNLNVFIYLTVIIFYFIKRTSWAKAKNDFKQKGAGRNVFFIVAGWLSIYFVNMFILSLFYKEMPPFLVFALENTANVMNMFIFVLLPMIPFLTKKGVFSYPGDSWNFHQYSKSRLEITKLKEIKEKLSFLMESEKFYLHDKVKMQQIAKKINFSPYQISEYINSQLNQNFNDYINSYRIEEAQRLLLEKKELNILQTGFEAGFNSTATFYRAFQKFTGLSPEKWLEKQK